MSDFFNLNFTASLCSTHQAVELQYVVPVQ